MSFIPQLLYCKHKFLCNYFMLSYCHFLLGKRITRRKAALNVLSLIPPFQCSFCALNRLRTMSQHCSGVRESEVNKILTSGHGIYWGKYTEFLCFIKSQVMTWAETANSTFRTILDFKHTHIHTLAQLQNNSHLLPKKANKQIIILNKNETKFHSTI